MTLPALHVDAAPRLVTLPCARRWPKSLDGRELRPIRGTWHPLLLRKGEEETPTLVPLVSCPRCARQIALVLDAEAARLATRARPGSAVPAISAVDEQGRVSPEPRCGCGWYAPTMLGEWNRWQILWCGVFKEDGRALLRTLYTHAADAREARETIIGNRRDRHLVSIAPVIRNDQERTILLTGLETP